MQTIKSDKILIRAIAKTVINYKKDTVNLLKKYYPKFNEKSETGEVVSFLLIKLSENPKFANDFSKLMQDKKTLVLTSKNEYKSWVTAVVSAVSGLASKIIGSQTAKREQETAKDNLTAEMLQALAEERKAKAKKETMQTLIIIVSIIAVVGIGGLIIYKTGKN